MRAVVGSGSVMEIQSLRLATITSVRRHHHRINRDGLFNWDNPVSNIKLHSVLIQSAYKDFGMSRYRLGLTESITVPSLRGATEKVELVISICEHDPLLEERKKVFESSGHAVRYVIRHPRDVPVRRGNIIGKDPWEIPSGIRVLTGRLDDDDALPVDHFAMTRAFAERTRQKNVLLQWPNGYILRNGQLRTFKRYSNQFISVVSETGLTPRHHSHLTFNKIIPVHNVSRSRGWLWVRHERTVSSNKKYRGRVASEPNRTRWSITLPPARRGPLAGILP